MKVLKKIFSLFLFVSLMFLNSFSFASKWDQSAVQILDDLKDKKVQDTALDNSVTTYNKWVTSTLEAVKKSSNWYLQWLAYIWLGIALILIIYNGIMLLISGMTWSDEMSKFKKRFVNLVIWVVILTSGYLIIKFVVSIVGQLF